MRNSNELTSYKLYKKYKRKYLNLLGGADQSLKSMSLFQLMQRATSIKVNQDELEQAITKDAVISLIESKEKELKEIAEIPSTEIDLVCSSCNKGVRTVDGVYLGPVNAACEQCECSRRYHRRCLNSIIQQDNKCPGCGNRCVRSHPTWGLGSKGMPKGDGRTLSGFDCYCHKHGYTLCYRGSCTNCMRSHGVDPQDICLGGDGKIELQDGTSKLVKELQIGDMVKSQGGYSKIKQVVHSTPTTRSLCQVDGVILTHRHPIYREGAWCHPIDVADVYQDTVPVYNFVMDGSPDDQATHTIIVNELTCATIGCGPANLAKIKPETDAKYGSGFWSNQ